MSFWKDVICCCSGGGGGGGSVINCSELDPCPSSPCTKYFPLEFAIAQDTKMPFTIADFNNADLGCQIDDAGGCGCVNSLVNSATSCWADMTDYTKFGDTYSQWCNGAWVAGAAGPCKNGLTNPNPPYNSCTCGAEDPSCSGCLIYPCMTTWNCEQDCLINESGECGKISTARGILDETRVTGIGKKFLVPSSSNVGFSFSNTVMPASAYVSSTSYSELKWDGNTDGDCDGWSSFCGGIGASIVCADDVAASGCVRPGQCYKYWTPRYGGSVGVPDSPVPYITLSDYAGGFVGRVSVTSMIGGERELWHDNGWGDCCFTSEWDQRLSVTTYFGIAAMPSAGAAAFTVFGHESNTPISGTTFANASMKGFTVPLDFNDWPDIP